MKKQDFLQMMVQDNETQPDKSTKVLHTEVIDCMELALSQSPDSIEIEPGKNLKDAFDIIKSEAMKNSNSCGPFRAAELLAKYLGVNYSRATKKFASIPSVDLEDFL